MTRITVDVTADDVAFGRNPGETHNPYWATPVERALSRLTGQEVSVDADGPPDAIATIGQGEWTLVVSLPSAAAEWLDDRWARDTEGDPLSFDILVPDWILDLIRDDRPLLTLREAGEILGVKAATLRQLAGREASDDERSPRARRLKAVKLGRDWFVDRVAVEAEAAR